MSDETADIFHMQEGVLYTQPKYGAVFVILEPEKSFPNVDACLAIRNTIKETWEASSTFKFNVVAGFDPEVWEAAMKQSGKEDWEIKAGRLEKRDASRNIVEGSDKFLNTGGLACIVARSGDNDVEAFNIKLNELERSLNAIGEEYGLVIEKTVCGTTNVLSGIFIDGLGNKSESSALQEAIGCKAGVNGYPGGSYMLQQKFRFDWEILSQKNVIDLAKMIGRHKENALVVGKTERTHVTRVHLIKPNLHSTSNFKLHRISMPFDDTKTVEDTSGGFGGANKESGLFYISFSKSQKYVKQLLENMVGERPQVTTDSLISTTSCIGGAFYYLPAAEEFGVKSPGPLPMSDLLFDHWDVKPENNKYLFYNHKEYLNRMLNSKRAILSGEENAENDQYPDPPSQRILHLLKSTFENWEDTWFHPRKAEPIPHLFTFDNENIEPENEPLIIRQALAVKCTLGSVYTTSDFEDNLKESYGVVHDLFRINPRDILAGKMPLYGLGIGQIAMPYLKPDTEYELSSENIKAYFHKLNEVSGYGHVVPNYSTILAIGVPGFLQELHRLKEKAGDENTRQYYRSCSIAFTGIREYLDNYASLAFHLAKEGDSKDIDFALPERDIKNLKGIGERMKHLATGKPKCFLEAIQLIFSLHACLHLTSEPVSIGRIDVMLEPFLQKEWEKYVENPEQYQDIIDAFWIKIGEKVQLSRETRLDLYKVGTIAVPYRSDGRFPRGDGCNQWVQQITVGGYSLNSDGEKVRPSEARDAIAEMCLKAARRLPLNAPCLSLRVHHRMNEKVLAEAAKSILSGGAHPILHHDERLIPALEYAGLPLRQAVTYSSDGCYEPIIPGKSEFSFAYVPLLKVLEYTINRGASIFEAGPAGMRGYCISQEFRPGSDDIKSLSDLKRQFGKHLRLQFHDAIAGLLLNYGNISNIYASQLLSTMIDGCMRSGKDIYNGGAEIKLIALMAISFANTVDSLYAIQELCFGDDSTISLEYLLEALKSDWGFNLQEPWQDPTDGDIASQVNGLNMKMIREKALELPKLGLRAKENERNAKRLSDSRYSSLEDIADWLAKECVQAFKEVTSKDNAKYPLQGIIKGLEEKHGEITFALGSGTFEGYVGWGLGIAASADGRRKGQPIASDMSPTPTPQDLPDSIVKIDDVYSMLEYWDIPEMKTKYSNGCEIDLVISEGTSEEKLTDFLRHYANEDKKLGGNVLTITCADQDTYRAAMNNPEQHDLIRVRTGGWTEFYISFYSPHQLQQLRRTRAVISSSPDVTTTTIEANDEELPERIRNKRIRMDRRKRKQEKQEEEKRSKMPKYVY